MKIRIDKEQEIQAALDAVNKKATRHVIGHPTALEVAQRAEKWLEQRGCPKKARKGVSVTYTPRGPNSSSYGYSCKSTWVRLERGSQHWFLVSAAEETIYPKQVERFCVRLERDATVAIIRSALRGAHVAGGQAVMSGLSIEEVTR